MPSAWDHKSDKDLLLAIIENGVLKGIEWPKIAQKMTAKGYTFTHEGCRQHFQKIRKEARSDPSPNPNSPVATPKKRPASSSKKVATPSKGKTFSDSFNSTPTSKGNSFSFVKEFDESEDDEIDTPQLNRVKKMKLENENGLQSAPLFKMENLDANGYNGARGSGVVILDRDDLYDDEG
ncbi:uncharacterized protein BP5553_08372 [Venustampulla echinocandica]|uniref:Myb-like domain-containing protein n=1 Tax=Venustampulla echinocandica TaxID=2656787 RepID=A0A370TGH6_9HELO|nr:uncharacterized protein BP5553_08372 [Venustampulla echinocandica]RDL34004.1 hypothetical protein BP5553_08372 [Venustampulla echinocandica]